MREKNERRIGIKLWMMLVVVCILCVMSVSANVCYGKAEEVKTAATEQQFNIEATFGIGNVVRVGKKMTANITVTNNGEDFSGLIQILIPATESNNVMYENELSIAAGETKKISMPMYMSAYTRKLIVNLTDEKENIISKKRVKIEALAENDEQKMVGILTDNKDVLGYWEEEGKRIFYLSQQQMPEQEAGLDALDLLIINNTDTQNLNKKQYEALKDWVNKGGNLIIGTGANVNRTLGVFQDDFLTGSFRAVSKDGKVKFTVEDASVFSDKKNDINMQQIKQELGSILLFSTDLGVDYANWKKKGAAYKNMVYEHMVEKVQSEEYRYFSDSHGLNLTDKGKLPSLSKYAIALSIYVVVVSWILYFVLKKKDKLEWTWGLVPAIAAVFALIVYGMGAATRITEPFITYARVIEWNGEGELVGKGTTRMAVTSPYNEKYSVAVPKGVTVYSGKADFSDYYDETETNFNEYNIGFHQSGEQQIITMNNLGAFESGSIRTDDVVSIKGSYEADITCEKYQFSGTFTNKTGSEIRNAVFLANGRMYQLGNIKDGETVDISKKCKNLVSFLLEDYTLSYDVEPFEEVFGISGGGAYTTGGTLEENRFSQAVSYYLSEKGTDIFREARVIGIMESDGADEDMTQSWGMDCSGITISVFPIDVNYTNKEKQTFVPDLITYGNVGDGLDEEYRTLYNQEVMIEYPLKKNETLTGLYYLSEINAAVPRRTKKGNTMYLLNSNDFEGEIYAYNYETTEYEKIFEGTTTGEIKDVKRFVGEDNILLLKMKPRDEDCEYMAPVISATKEVK